MTPTTKVVAEALDAAQEGDFGTVVDVLDPDSGELGDLKGMLGPNGTELTEEQQVVFDKFALMLRDFDYEITGERVDGEDHGYRIPVRLSGHAEEDPEQDVRQGHQHGHVL